MEKINIAELLKDCPKGMELYCTTWENVTFEKVVSDKIYIKRNKKTNPYDNIVVLNQYGCTTNHQDEKCRIFPKGKTTWEGFVPPCKFKDGDIVTWKDRGSLVAFIYKERKDVALVKHHFALYIGSLGTVTDGEISLVENEIVFATEEEKQKLFDAIKANGYKWNAESKTLEKLIKPKFKVGDRIVKQNSISNSWIISSVSSEYYGLKLPENVEDIGVLPVSEQDNYELLLNTNKFDITTLKPFESKVLVRDTDTDVWKGAFYSHYKPKKFYIIGCSYYQCIPYEGNEHLLGTTNDCDDFYKTW